MRRTFKLHIERSPLSWLPQRLEFDSKTLPWLSLFLSKDSVFTWSHLLQKRSLDSVSSASKTLSWLSLTLVSPHPKILSWLSFACFKDLVLTRLHPTQRLYLDSVLIGLAFSKDSILTWSHLLQTLCLDSVSPSLKTRSWLGLTFSKVLPPSKTQSWLSLTSSKDSVLTRSCSFQDLVLTWSYLLQILSHD